MAKAGDITGMTDVLKRLNQYQTEIVGGTLKGLIRASLVVRRAMDKQEPKIPVDEGNLRASFFIVASDGKRPRGTSPNFKGENSSEMASTHEQVITEVSAYVQNSRKPVVAFGFTASYAFFVHEKVDSDIEWTRPGSGAKYLEAALIMNEKAMMQVIKESASIK